MRSLECPSDLLWILASNHVGYSVAEDVHQSLDIKVVCSLD